MRTLFLFIGFWIYQLAILPFQVACVLLLRVGQSGKARWLANRTAYRWASHLMCMAGTRVRVHGAVDLPEERSALYIANHQGAFDIPLWIAFLGRPVAFLAKKELESIPLLGRWMQLIGCVFIVREDRRKSLEAIKESIASLQAGTNLVVFPEGTRSNAMTMAPFKKGSLSIAQKAGVPIVPLTVKGSFRIKPDDGKRICQAEVDLYIDAPIETDALSKEEADTLHERVQAIIQANLDRS